jgi:hypothetical protein
MGFKLTFLAGFAAGYVAGAAAGRERYEQIKTASSKVAGNPAVQRATGTVGTKAAELSKTAKDKAADKLPKFAATAVSKAGGNPDKIPGVGSRVNGSSDYSTPAPDTYNPPPGTAS